MFGTLWKNSKFSKLKPNSSNYYILSSQLQRATIVCFLLHNETTTKPIVKQYLVVESLLFNHQKDNYKDKINHHQAITLNNIDVKNLTIQWNLSKK